jgi:hypothetical protein
LPSPPPESGRAPGPQPRMPAEMPDNGETSARGTAARREVRRGDGHLAAG